MKHIFEYYNEDIYLAHHGIMGQKWGVRRFQNRDGTLTPAGKERYHILTHKYQNKDGSLTEAGKERYLRPNGTFDYSKRNAKGFEGKIATEILEKWSKHEDKIAYEEVNDIRNMPQKTESQRREKAEKEKELLEGWDDSHEQDPDYGRKLSRSAAVMHMIDKEVMNSYKSEPSRNKAPHFMVERNRIYDKLWRDYRAATTEAEKMAAIELYNRKMRESDQQINQMVLEKLGFENNETNRRLIQPYWDDD